MQNKIVLVAAMTFRGAVSWYVFCRLLITHTLVSFRTHSYPRCLILFSAHCGQYLVSNIIAIRIDNEKIWAFTHYACYKAIIGTAKVSYDRISYQRGIKCVPN